MTLGSSPDSSEAFEVLLVSTKFNTLCHSSFLAPGKEALHLSYSKHTLLGLSSMPIKGFHGKLYGWALHNFRRCHSYTTHTATGGQPVPGSLCKLIYSFKSSEY